MDKGEEPLAVLVVADRAKSSTKQHVGTDRQGIPLVATIIDVERPDEPVFEALV